MLLAGEVTATVWLPSFDVISARQCTYRVRALSGGDDVTGRHAVAVTSPGKSMVAVA